jgi:hypothetical protein
MPKGVALKTHKLIDAARHVLEEIQPASVRAVCYKRVDLELAWNRYLPAILSDTPAQPSNHAASSDSASDTVKNRVSDRKRLEPASNKDCAVVPDKKAQNPDFGKGPPTDLRGSAGTAAKSTFSHPQGGRYEVAQ